MAAKGTNQKKPSPYAFTAILIVVAIATAIICVLIGLFAIYGLRKKNAIEQLDWKDVGQIVIIAAVLAIPIYLFGIIIGIPYLIVAIALYYWQKNKFNNKG